MTSLSLIAGEFLISLGLIATLDLVVAKVSVWSVGHIGFFALGQLVVGFMVSSGATGPAGGLLVAAGLGIVAAVLVGLSTFRLSGDYFIILSIAFVAVVEGLSLALLGPTGISGIPRLFASAIDLDPWLYLAVFLAPPVALAFGFRECFRRSPFQRAAAVTRRSTLIAQSMGIDSFKLRLGVFAVASSLAVLMGGISVTYFGHSDPQWATVYRGILLFAMMLFGGLDSWRGSLVGATVLVATPRLLAYLLRGPLASFHAAQLSSLAFAVVLLVTVRLLPLGLTGRQHWDIEEADR